MSDQAAAQAKQMRSPRAASDEAAVQNIERRQGITQKSGVQIDRKRIEYTPETQVGNMTISRGQQVTDREEMGAGAPGGITGPARQQRLAAQLSRDRRAAPGGNRPGVRDAANAALGAADMAKVATMPARATPAGAAVGAGLEGATGGAKAAMMALKAVKSGGISKKELSQTFGRGCVKILWQNLWLTFGHSIYFLAIIFFASAHSKFARKYFPRVGEEWFPPDLISKIPKAAMLPLKLAELCGIGFVMFWVLLLDLTCIGMFAFFIGIIVTATGAV